MLTEIEYQHQLENTWNKLARLQHHSHFLKTCMNKKLIPKGLQLNFNLSVNINDSKLQEHCKRQLNLASQNIISGIYKSTLDEIPRLQSKLEEIKIDMFNNLSIEKGEDVWAKTKSKISKLQIYLAKLEQHKLGKTIKMVDFQENRNNDIEIRSPSNHQKTRNRRFKKSLRRSRRKFKTSVEENINADSISNLNDHALKQDPINLTTSDLTEEQKQVLRRGPSFCPAPKDINWMKLHDDWERFQRNVRLKAYFHKRNTGITEDQAQDQDLSQEEEQETLPKVPKSKHWNPPRSSIPELEMFLAEVKKGIFDPSNIRTSKDNLSFKERKALKELRNNQSSVIRIQDKGSSFVLLNREDYIEKMNSQLDNPIHYKKLQNDPTEKYLSKVSKWSMKWLRNSQISKEIAEWVVNDKAKPGTAFGNVKTHKQGNPLRLITSCCGTAIENLSAFTEFYLKPLASKLPSFIKDTTDLLNRIHELNRSGPLPQNTLLVSWDVVGMFPNIDNNLGLTAVKNALDSRAVKSPSTECILEAVEICLKHNNSSFNDKFYLQTHGTAMGPKNACSYADLAMGEIDNLAKTSDNIRPSHWWRYRDDIIDFWTQGYDKLQEFTEYINSLYPTIKFTLVYSEKELNVLDLTLHLVNGYIETDVYAKPTDSHLYLPPSSAHPQHCKKSIPYSVALRLKRNCSTKEFLDKRFHEYQQYLTQQGYNKSMVEKQFQKANLISRTELLKPRVAKNKRKVVPLVVDYNPNLPNIQGIIKENFHFLNSSENLRKMFPENSVITAFRRPKNLKEILAPSKLRLVGDTSAPITSDKSNLGCFKCSRKCDLCRNYLVQSNAFTSFRTKKKYFINQKLNCQSKNVVYLISCNKCSLQYIGSTSNEFKVRFRNHKSAMLTKKKTCEVAIHFNEISHQLSDFSFICLESIHNTENTDQVLLNREAYWSSQLFTWQPHGLNKRQEFKSTNRINYNP